MDVKFATPGGSAAVETSFNDNKSTDATVPLVSADNTVRY